MPQSVLVVTRLEDDAGFTGFQNINTAFNSTVLAFSNTTKFGIPGSVAFRVSGPSIPKNAKIDLARFIFEASLTTSGSISALFQMYRQVTTQAWYPASSTKWVQSIDWDARAEIWNASSQTLATTNVGIVATGAELRRYSSPNKFQRIGQTVKITSAGDAKFLRMGLKRVGSHTGNVWLELWDTVAFAPNSLLATTTPVSFNSISNSSNHDYFTFTIPSTVPVSLNSTYLVFVTGDYPINGSNYITVGIQGVWLTGPYADGTLWNYGEGRGFDDQNYFSHGDLASYPTLLGVGDSVITISDFIINQQKIIGGMTSSVQALVDHASYIEGGVIGFRIFPTTPGDYSFQFKAFEHSSTNDPRLVVDWTPKALGKKKIFYPIGARGKAGTGSPFYPSGSREL